MKKLILIFALFSSFAFGQTPGRIFSGSTAPTGRYLNYVLGRDIYCDTVAKLYYVSKVANVWKLAPGYGSGTGGGGLNSFTIGTVTTGSAGSSADATLTGTVSDPVLNLTIPRGNTGATGSGGSGGDGGWVFNVFTSPDYYGAVHASQTFAQAGLSQPYIDSAYAGIGATTADQIDWAALQMAFNDACDNGKGLILTGGAALPYKINRAIYLRKYFISINVYGNWGMIESLSGGTYDLITRTAPTDNNDANVMINNSYTHFNDLLLKGGLSQIGINIYSTYGATYHNVRGFNLKTVIHLRFSLQTDLNYCYATNCTNGMIADMGNWSGATNSNSQSNHTTFTSCHYYGDGENAGGSIVGSAFQAIASSGCTFNDCIVEGASVLYGILIDSKGSAVVKTGYIKNCHVECVNGTAGSFINWIPAGGILTIDGIFGQYAGIMVSVDMQYGSYSTTILKDVVWWVPVNMGGVNKYYKSTNGATWQFLYNDQVTPGTPAEISNQFVTTGGGIAPTYCTSTTGGCGGNRFGVTYISR